LFRLILALDLLDGKIVHAIRGEREKYTPIHVFSKFVETSDPLAVIEKMMPEEVYIADINRLMGTGDNRGDIQSVSTFCRTMLDWGVRRIEDVEFASGIADNVILGTETSSFKLIEESTAFDISVSIDIKNGRVLSPDDDKSDSLDFVRKLNDYDVMDLIILEINRIGTKSGVDAEFLGDVLAISDHEIIVGGGISNAADISVLREIGASGVIVSTAIHDGSIPIRSIR
jgi:phosphoribosylformimino-5-aminoimidazole carboxamide ribotide isomerase